MDAIRGTGTTKWLSSNLTSAEGVNYANANVTSLDANGFTIGSTAGTDILNQSGTATVAWAWDAGDTTVTNNEGSVASQVRSNGNFSIVSWTGDGDSNISIGHGCTTAPAFVVIKNIDKSQDWPTYHVSAGVANSLFFNASYSAGQFGPVVDSVDSTTITNASGTTYLSDTGKRFIAYCWAESPTQSFGSYTGNGSADGPFVYTGFKIRWLMVKSSSNSGEHWLILDTARDTYNLADATIYANLSNAEFEASALGIDILSNGFKPRGTNAGTNASGYTYIYIAFASHPFKTARAR
jgi:hypothetical protein